VKWDHNLNFWYFQNNHIKTTKIFSVWSSPDPPIFKKIAVRSSPDPAKISFSPDPVRSSPVHAHLFRLAAGATGGQCRDDHYPVCRLDIRQDSEFATGYRYPKTAFKRDWIRIRISETLLSIFLGFRLLEKLHIAQSLIYYL